MPPAKIIAPLTDEEKYKAQLQAEQELNRLQRRYNLLEKDRHHFCGAKIARLNHVLTITKKEYRNISTDLKVANSPEKKKTDVNAHQQLALILQDRDTYTSRVNREKQYMEEIEFQIKSVKKEVIRLRSLQTSDKQHEERVCAAVKTIEALENKLEVQVKKFGGIYMELCDLREKISGLLWERDNFMKIWKKLIGKLTLGKRFMLDLIEQATLAYDQREEWCNKLHLLRIKANNDLIMHTEQMRQLSRKQNDNKKLEDFLAIKSQRRIMRDLEHKETIKRKKYHQKLKERLNNYEELMNEILEFTQEPRINMIAHKFYTQEAENLMYFNYINDLMEEMETISDKLGHLHLDIEENKALSNMRNITQNKTLEDLQSQLEKVQKEYEISEEKIAFDRSYLEKVFSEIDTLFKICKCNSDPILELLGDNRKINHFNAKLYLELIEKKVLHAMLEIYCRNKILYEKRRISWKQRIIAEDITKPVLYSVDTITRKTPCPLCFEHELVSDVVDRLQQVLTRQGAQERVKFGDFSGVHNVSDCYLPKSRSIIQKRYQ